MDAVARWDFRGFHGAFRQETKDIAWFHVVFPLTAALEQGNITFLVTWEFAKAEDGPLNSIDFLGYEIESAQPTGRSAYSNESSRSSGAYAYVGGQRYNASVPQNAPTLPLLTLQRSGTQIRVGFDNKSLLRMYDNSQKDGEPKSRRMVLFFYMIGEAHPIRTTIEAAWTNTLVSFTTGNASSVFAKYLDDFGVDSRVGAEVGSVQATVGKDYHLGMNLGEPGKLVAFDFLAITSLGGLVLTPELEKGNYARPDGTEVKLTGSEGGEFSVQHGTWNFRIPSNTLLLNSRLPVLWGCVFTPALPPWRAAPTDSS